MNELDSKLDGTLNQDNEGRKKTDPLVIALGILNIICLAILITLVVYAQRTQENVGKPSKSPLDHLAEQFMDSLPASLLPDSYAVPYVARNPATNQAHRGTCWAWATMYILETAYRQQAVKQGYLGKNQYVKFSIQAYASYLGNFCLAHKDNKVCQYGGFKRQNPSTNDNQVEAFPYFLKEIENLSYSIVPDTVCPYVPDESNVTDFQCDNFEEAVKKNPIRFKFNGMTTVYDTRAIKQLLYAKQTPLGIGTPLGSINYVVKCDDPKYANLSQCTEESFICPGSQTEEKCAKIVIDAITSDGVFVSIDKAQRQNTIGGHAMNVVAYNDNWRYLNRIAGPNSVESSQGCFVLHNSWEANGHSIEFLMGKRTVENEAVSCPNHRLPENWIPATAECAKQNFADVSKCSKDLRRIRGKGLTDGADRLICKSKNSINCKYNYSYVLKRIDDGLDVYELDNGLHSVGMIEWNEEQEPREVRIETAPFFALSSYFAPAGKIVENNADECGFYALPYQSVENMRKRSLELFDNFKVSHIDLTFEPSSFATSPESKSYNTTWLNESTYNINETVFDGPVPFNLVY